MGKIGRMASAGFRAIGGMDTLKAAGGAGLSSLMSGGGFGGALKAAGGAGLSAGKEAVMGGEGGAMGAAKSVAGAGGFSW